jgi:hypothetical protein
MNIFFVLVSLQNRALVFAIKLDHFIMNALLSYVTNTQAYQRKLEKKEIKDWYDQLWFIILIKKTCKDAFHRFFR